MPPLALACAIAMLPAVVASLWTRWREEHAGPAGPSPALRAAVLLTKGVASALFLGAAAAVSPLDPDLGRWLRVGLVASFLGDLALAVHGRPAFVVGLVAFLGAHLAYLAALAPRIVWDGLHGGAGVAAGGLSCALSIACSLALRAGWTKLGPLRAPASLYGAALTAMTAAAAAAGLCGAGAGRWLLALAALLFFVSDLAVLRQRFVRPDFTNRLWGQPAYYAAQLLFALALGLAR